MRETYRVEYRTEIDDRWLGWLDFETKADAQTHARNIANDLHQVRVVTVTEQFEIVHPPKEHTDA